MSARRARAFIAAAGVLTVGVFATLVFGASVRAGAEREAEDRFEDSAEQAATTIERQVGELRDIGSFVVSSPDVDSASFDRFVEGTGLFEQLPSFVGAIFLHRVAGEDLDEFVSGMRAEAIQDFSLSEIGERDPEDPYLLVSYYTPGRIDLELPIGTDVSSIRALSQVLSASAETGSGTAGSFQDDPLLQRIAEETEFPLADALFDLDFFIGVPVYERPSTRSTRSTNGQSAGWPRPSMTSTPCSGRPTASSSGATSSTRFPSRRSYSAGRRDHPGHQPRLETTPRRGRADTGR